MKMCMWINNKALSSTLFEGLAPHNHKRHYKINWNHEKAKLTIEKHSQRPKHDKSHDFTLYGSSQCRVNKRKLLIYTKRLGFLTCWQVITSALNRSQCTRSHYARSRRLRSNACGASSSVQRGPLTMILGFHLTWPTLDLSLCARSHMRLIAKPALDCTARVALVFSYT